VLAGQKALVTGANSGIGRAVAVALGEAGADVVVNYVGGGDRAAAVVEEIRRCGVDAFAHQADVSQEDQVEAMFREAVAKLGTIDILVANAGLQQDAPIHEMTLAQWNTVIGVNLTGQFLCARAAVREFLRRGVFGVTAWYPSTLRIALGQASTWPAIFAAALCDGVPLGAVADEGSPLTKFRPPGRLRFAG